MSTEDNEIREQRLRRALHARADEVTARDLTKTWRDVLREADRTGSGRDPVDLFDAARTGPRRQRFPVAAAAALAAAVLVVGGLAVAGLQRGSSPGPTPAGQTVESTPVLGSTPTERPRGEIPWASVGQGWTGATWATAAAATDPATLYLVSPSGVRFAVGHVPPHTTVLDVSPDGRRMLTEALTTSGATVTGSPPPSISEWDVTAGTSRGIPLATDVTPVTTSVRYTKPSGRAILVEYLQAVTLQPVIERRSLDGALQLRYPAIPGLRAPLGLDGPGPLATPDGLDFIVPTTGGMALVGNAQGTLVRSYPLPPGTATCSPVSWWAAGILLARCDGQGGMTSDLWTFPVSGAPAERRTLLATSGGTGYSGAASGWSSAAGVLVLERPRDGLECTPARLSLIANPDSRPAPFSPVLPGSVGSPTGIVPLAVQGRFAFLAVRGCNRPGASLLVYDLVAHAAYPLLGPGADAGTVVSSVTLDPGR